MKTKTIIDRFTPTVKNTLNMMINEKVTAKLNAALNTSGESKVKIKEDIKEDIIEKEEVKKKNEELIVTTPEELESYAMVKVASSDVIEAKRIFYRDNRSYFNILVDDNIRKWIARIYFTKSKNTFILNDEEKTVIEFDSPIDLLKHREKINEVILKFT